MKYLKYCSILLIIILISIPSASAWSWQTHSQIVDAVYHGLPDEVQKNLDLNVMREASNDPDEIFKDFYYHSYPKSYAKAQTWLSKGKEAYNRGDYRNASYCYGVASHYISDSFSAPHTISKESSSDHSKYEDQAEKLTPVAKYTASELKTKMEEGYNQGKTSWANWLQTKDSSIIQNNLNMGASAALSAIADSINNTSSAQNQNIFTEFYEFLENLA
ncbi:MAG: zinc dependent phospholipase C family protein [Methanobacterium sp.]|nr:zinc dependent phospholipase C family protein [Methanobacterium sp.]